MADERAEAAATRVRHGLAPKRADPAHELRRAWSSLRLERLQSLVSETIERLRAVEPQELLGRDPEPLEASSLGSPIAAALEACSGELWEESGVHDRLPLRESHQQRLDLAPDAPRTWGDEFYEALERYRELAGALLAAAIDEASAEPTPGQGGAARKDAPDRKG